MKAYHFLVADMRSRNGDEPPWRIGETRTIKGAISLCSSGYHSCLTWGDCLDYLYGPIACEVEVSDPIEKDEDKQVSASRTLVSARDASKQLRLFAAACAEDVLLRLESKTGKAAHKEGWNAVMVATKFAIGSATREELAAAYTYAAAAAAYAYAAAADDAAAAAADADAAAAAYAAAAYAVTAAVRKEVKAWQRKVLTIALNGN